MQNIDLTGTNINHVKTLKIALYQENQVVDFEEPVHYERISVKIIGTDIEMVRDDGFIKGSVDDTLLGKIKLANRDHDHTPVTSIVLSNTDMQFSNEYIVEIKYQCYLPSTIRTSYEVGKQVELSPELIVEMLDKLTQLESYQDTHFKGSDLVVNESNIRFLELDLDKTNDVNDIKDEVHIIDSSNNRTTIVPQCGSFYHTPVKIVEKANNRILEEDEYEFVGLDLEKIKISTVPDKIYAGIRIKREMVGEVEISYHAFGGIPDITSFNKLSDKVRTLEKYLSDNSFMSASSIGTNSNIMALKNKVIALEEKMKKFASGSNYSDVTSGSTTTLKTQSTDNNYHWWSIATLYKVAGSDEVLYDDIFKFHIELNNTNAHITGSVYANTKPDINIPDEDRLRVVIDNNSPNISDIDIKFRIIYNVNVANVVSGTILQIGYKIPHLIETMCVEDLSGKESAWVLRPTSETVISNDDSTVLLPNGIVSWTKGDPVSKEIVRTALPIDGYNFKEGIDIPSVVNSNSDELFVDTIRSISRDDVDDIRNMSVTLSLDYNGTVHKIATSTSTLTKVVSGDSVSVIGISNIVSPTNIEYKVSTILKVLPTGNKVAVKISKTVNESEPPAISVEKYSIR